MSVDPKLGPLVNNDGFTKTMALQAGSPAIDAGSDTGCPATDQRGVERPQGSHCDMGAYEFNGTFTDVPLNHWAWRWIEQFYEGGITTGCFTAPLKYCPERQVTRAEMTVFILRDKYGSNYQPNPSQTGIFADVPVTGKAWMQPRIEQFYQEGITTGCNQSPLKYYPERPVTRAEKAVFIDRAFGIPPLP